MIGWTPISSGEDFFDTDVVLQLLSADARKADRAGEVIALGGTVSVQVLNEFAAVACREPGMPLNEAREVPAQVRAVCSVEPITIGTREKALSVAQRCCLSF